jgi:Ger(x)C family germination protein
MTGCFDQTNLEDVSMTLILGIDLNEKDNLMVYMVSPVFEEEAKEKDESNVVKSVTIRDSREGFDTTVMGLTSGSKTQVILIGKRLLEKKYWTNYLDPFLRDPKNTVTPRVVAVEGNVSDVIFYKPKDKARLPVYLTKLIDTSYTRNITVKTNLQEFHNQIMEKGITPSITALKKNDKLSLKGSVLLDEKDTYKLKISPNENKLLRILQHKTKGEFPFTVVLPSESNKKEKRWLSFTPLNIKVKTKVRDENNNFRFDINIKMKIALTERLFRINMRKNATKLQKSIETKMQEEFKSFINKIQKAKIDPVGFGIYARAYEYPKWKKVQDHWGKAFSKADVHVKVNVTIAGMGTIK